jgi:signal transduction histidine kinase
MTRLGLAVSGKTLGWAQGLAGLRPPGLRYKVQRAALTALAIGALIASLSATSVAITGVADDGVTTDGSGTVIAVSRTGFAWSAGVRPRDVVLSIVASDDPGGWQMVTRDASGNEHTANGRDASSGLAAALPVGFVAIFLAGLGLLFLSTRRRWVVPAAALALYAASIPLALNGAADSSTLVLGASALVPAVSLGRRLPIAVVARFGLGVALVVFLVAWAIARLNGTDAAEAFELVRGGIALWGLLALLADRAVVPILRGEAIGVMRPRLFDVGVIASFAVIGLVLMTAFSVQPIVVGALLVAVMAVLPSTRRRIGEPLEDALFGDVREAAAADAAEAERARLARDLHDVPLQELVAVIRRLEIMPGAEAESEDLRNLAGHLRNVATELRPPVLDDLGLPAALDYLAEESTSNALPVSAEIVDETGFGAERRPPADVELAMYRIASEAVGNAVRHSGGTRVRIGGSVAPGRVELTVADDGAGLAPDAAREAAKRKRMGLASMRRRAQAIDAELSIDGSTRGTQVRVAWQA